MGIATLDFYKSKFVELSTNKWHPKKVLYNWSVQSLTIINRHWNYQHLSKWMKRMKKWRVIDKIHFSVFIFIFLALGSIHRYGPAYWPVPLAQAQGNSCVSGHCKNDSAACQTHNKHSHGVVREYWRGKYHCTVDLLFDWFGLVCFANKNKHWQ